MPFASQARCFSKVALVEPLDSAETFAVKLMRPENRDRCFQYLRLAQDVYEVSRDQSRYWVIDMTWQGAPQGPKILKESLSESVLQLIQRLLPGDFRMVGRFERNGDMLEVWLGFRGTSNPVEAL